MPTEHGTGNHDVQRDQHRVPGQAAAATGDVSRGLPVLPEPALVREDGGAEQLQGGERPVYAGPVRHRQQRAVQRLQRHGRLGPADDAVLDHGELFDERDTFLEASYGYFLNDIATTATTPASNINNTPGLANFPRLFPNAGFLEPGFYAYKRLTSLGPDAAPFFRDGEFQIPPSFSFGKRGREQPGHHATRLLLHAKPRAQRQLQCDQDRRPPHAESPVCSTNMPTSRRIRTRTIAGR